MRAGRTLANEQPSKRAQSRSECRSSTDITNTKRSKGGSAPTRLSEASLSVSSLVPSPEKWGRGESVATGDINLIAVLITHRLLQATAESLKTALSWTHRSNASRRHFAALASFPVKISANKYKRSRC